jgi:YggT family protein
MTSLLWLISTVINLYVWCIIISAILSWLIAFNVVNTQNRIIYLVGDTLYRITNPLLRPIRRYMPNLGGIDISPVILILALFFFRSLLFEYWPR